MSRTLFRGLATAALGAVVLGGLSWASMAWGTLESPGQEGAYGQSVVWALRWPRTLAGLAVGAALGVAGALMQAVTRNPLADPSVLGVNAGAAFAIVVAATLGHLNQPAQYLGFACAGGALSAAAVWILGGTCRHGGSPAKLALAGVVLSALVGSWTSAILLQNQQTLETVRFWLAGALGGQDKETLGVMLPLVALGLVAALALGPSLNVLGLGSDTARGLGLRTTWVRNLALAVVVWLTGCAVALAGPIGFIGLAVPHLARAWVGPDQRWILAASVLLGPSLLLGADIVGRVILRPSEVPVGIVTAVLGAPVLMALSRSSRLAR